MENTNKKEAEQHALQGDCVAIPSKLVFHVKNKLVNEFISSERERIKNQPRDYNSASQKDDIEYMELGMLDVP